MHTWLAPRSFAISSYAGSARFLVTNDPLEVCPFARRSDVATPIRSITERPSLSPASSARHHLGVPCGRACLHPKAGCRVCDVSPCLYTGSRFCPCAPLTRSEHPGCVAVWLEPVRVFGSL